MIQKNTLTIVSKGISAVHQPECHRGLVRILQPRRGTLCDSR